MISLHIRAVWSCSALSATLLYISVNDTPFSAINLYHAVSGITNPEKESFVKHCGKRRKCGFSAFSPFPTIFSTVQNMRNNFWDTFILLSANAFDLVPAKFLWSDEELNFFHFGRKRVKTSCKRETNACYPHFLLFPICFEVVSFPRSFLWKIMYGKHRKKQEDNRIN